MHAADCSSVLVGFPCAVQNQDPSCHSVDPSYQQHSYWIAQQNSVPSWSLHLYHQKIPYPAFELEYLAFFVAPLLLLVVVVPSPPLHAQFPPVVLQPAVFVQSTH